jgi:hypothetical protein
MHDLNLINSQLDLLKAASKNKRYRVPILRNADKKLVEAIRECVFNILKGNIPINTNDRFQLLKFRTVLHKLLKKDKFKNHKKIIVQHGQFLNFLIPPIVTGIASIVSALIARNKSE